MHSNPLLRSARPTPNVLVGGHTELSSLGSAAETSYRRRRFGSLGVCPLPNPKTSSCMSSSSRFDILSQVEEEIDAILTSNPLVHPLNPLHAASALDPLSSSLCTTLHPPSVLSVNMHVVNDLPPTMHEVNAPCPSPSCQLGQASGAAVDGVNGNPTYHLHDNHVIPNHLSSKPFENPPGHPSSMKPVNHSPCSPNPSAKSASVMISSMHEYQAWGYNKVSRNQILSCGLVAC
ncbi:hypothetical protein NE237_011161 [Protea cynaroides]|uniref:Uncharacterized protein n=1 Tax=Protea cynaroides TaxID=273540 RepID=A0A9Q0JY08_9MAGN|nr:hypothetical protein NE237_011161 [Protea cynaroides]